MNLRWVALENPLDLRHFIFASRTKLVNDDEKNKYQEKFHKIYEIVTQSQYTNTEVNNCLKLCRFTLVAE